MAHWNWTQLTMLALWLALSDCGKGPGGGAGAPPSDTGPVNGVTYEKDVRPLLERSCLGCHVKGGIAPFALTSFAEARPMGESMAASTAARSMPPYLAGPNCNEYEDNQRLTDDQVAIFDAWVKNGKPQGVQVAAPKEFTATPSSLPKVDFVAKLAAAYTPVKSPDDYRCFLVDFPLDKDQYVVGSNVVPGNPKIVHHVLVYVIPPEQVATIEAVDAKDPLPGYPCFGGPIGDDAPSGQQSDQGAGLDGLTKVLGGVIAGQGLDIGPFIPGLAKLPQISAWAPGGRPSMYPKDSGILVKKGSKLVMQMHYNVTNTADKPSDQSKVEIALADSVKNRGAVIPLTNPDWVDKDVMKLPKGQKQISYEFEFDPGIYFAYFLNDKTNSPLSGFEYMFQKYRIHNVASHQHQLGTSARIELRKKDGKTNQCLLDVPRWDFHWQLSYRLTTSTVMEPGDKLFLTCSWDNSQENQPVVDGVQKAPRDVKWGEDTASEMCVAFYYVTKE